MRIIQAPGQNKDEGEIYWFRFVSFTPGATFTIDGRKAYSIVGTHPFTCRGNQPFRRLEISGTATAEIGDSPDDPVPPPIAYPVLYDASGAVLVTLVGATSASPADVEKSLTAATVLQLDSGLVNRKTVKIQNKNTLLVVSIALDNAPSATHGTLLGYLDTVTYDLAAGNHVWGWTAAAMASSGNNLGLNVQEL